jgi:hypothetical protein
MNGSEIGHVDHPGTPLQVAGAVVIRICYFLSHDKEDIVEDVLYNPERYINAIDFTLILLNSTGLFIMGLIMYNVFKNIFISLLFQTIPWITINITEVFSLVKTETFAFSLMVILIAIMIKVTYNPPEKLRYYIIGTGILCGVIMAVKIGFLSLLIIPLLIFPSVKNKVTFLVITGLSFVIFVLPAVSNVSYFIDWVSNLILYSGRYGRGDSFILNTGTFFNNMLKIFSNERLYIILWFLMLITLAASLFIKKKSDPETNAKLKLLFAIFLAMSLQIILVAKHYSHRYMFAALLLIIPGFFVFLTIVLNRFFSGLNHKIVFATALSIAVIFCAYNSRKILSRSIVHDREAKQLHEFVNANYARSPIILSSGASHEFTGLILSYAYAGDNVRQKYSDIINKRFPDQPWFDIWTDQIYSISESSNIKDVLKTSEPILYQCTDEAWNEKFLKTFRSTYNLNNASLKEVYSNLNGDILYEIESIDN